MASETVFLVMIQSLQPDGTTAPKPVCAFRERFLAEAHARALEAAGEEAMAKAFGSRRTLARNTLALKCDVCEVPLAYARFQ